MAYDLKKLPAVFYWTASRSEPVRGWLKDLSQDDRGTIGHDIGSAEFGWPVGMPLCRPLGNGLWEVRNNLSNRNIARVIFCVHAGNIVLLHEFEKKTQKPPKPDLKIARKRQKETEQ